jgi:heat shock protein HslJ
MKTFPLNKTLTLATTAKARILPLVIAAALAVSCGRAPDTPSGANDSVQGEAAAAEAPVSAANPTPSAGFDGITGKDWKLIEVRSSADATASAVADAEASRYSRGELAEAGMENAYTLRFDGERLTGMGAPNRYFAPYTQGGGQTLSIGAIAGTLMASFSEPENLKEREYFGYLENAAAWDLVHGQLRIISRNGRGGETVLVFETE